MSEKTSVVLVGAGGFGTVYIHYFREVIDPQSFDLVGIVDPVADRSPAWGWIRESGVPVYATLSDFYEKHTAALAMIVSPVQFHKAQVLEALAHGSHVLCEKPLTALLQDARALAKARDEAGRALGVGFQWSFAKPMLDLKRDILSGSFGKPLSMKALVSWQRFDEYYADWKGRVRASDGSFLLDNIAFNATAHYLHNLFFIMGDKLSSSAFPLSLRGSLYRAKEIETYDTCFLKGAFENGCEFLFIATHSGDRNIDPTFEYRFERATVTLDCNGSSEMTARLEDGSVRVYGNPQNEDSGAEKLRVMLRIAREGGGELPCPVEAVLPHLAVTNAVFDYFPVRGFPKELVYRNEAPSGSFVTGLADDCLALYNAFSLPSEAGLPWAAEDESLPVSLRGYEGFSGLKFRPIS